MAVTKNYSFERVTLLQNTNGDSQPALAALTNGGFVSMLTHGGAHLDGNIFSPAGASTAILDQLLGTGSAVDQLANGNIAIASLSGGDIFHTIRSGTTGAQITASKAIGGGADPQNLAVTALTGGRFAVAFDQQNPSRDVGIEVFKSDGSDAFFSLAGNFSKENEINPALAGLSNGNLAFAYQSDAVDGGIYVGVFGPNGEIVKDRGQSGFDSTGTVNRNVSMTATGNGFAIVYEDNEYDGGNDITLARFALDGTLIGRTRINDPNSNYTNPSVTMLSNGMLAVTATYTNGDTDMAVMLVDASNGTTLTSTTVTADESGFDNLDFSTVAGVGHGLVAAQWLNSTDKGVDGELLDATVVSTGNGADDIIVADHLKDVIDGGGGIDTVSYADSDGAVTVTINGKGFNFHATNDRLTNVENLIGSAFDDFLFGDNGANKIEGGGGKDTIAAGGGTDQLDGGGNDDTFVFNDHLLGAGYIKGGAGTDAIVVTGVTGVYSIDLTDPQIESIEVLAFGAVADGGTGEVQFVGNQFGAGIASNASVIFSGSADGIETVRIFMEGDIDLDLSKLMISGNGAEDTFVVEGGDADETIAGSAFFDLIKGGKGADTLDGGKAFLGSGADTLEGGAGNDTYVIDSSFDIVDESVAGSNGSDTVRSSIISINLNFASKFKGTVENAALDGNANLSLNGNSLDNKLTGNSGVNTLDGGAGIDTLDGKGGGDTMRGFTGNDTYYIDSSGDIVDESVAGSSGSDTVRSSNLSINLGYASIFKGSIESAVLEGSASLNLTGNALVNYLQGNNGANIINGGGGSDTLVGLGGNDTFRFANSLGAANIDRITDYTVQQDRIELENSYFSALTTTGVLSAAAFTANTTGLAQDASDRIIYETDTGKLFYDSNGSAAGGTYQQFAQLAVGLSMTAGEFLVI